MGDDLAACKNSDNASFVGMGIGGMGIGRLPRTNFGDLETSPFADDCAIAMRWFRPLLG